MPKVAVKGIDKMTDAKTTERKDIKVVSVSAPRKVQDKYEVVEFKGADDVTYEVWSATLAAEVKEGAVIDAEVTHTTKVTEQATYHHHKITQIFNKDGQPVRGGKQGGGYGSYKGHSPEERRSIERQVSAKIACEFFNTEGIGVALTTAERIYQWIASPSDTTPVKPKKPKTAKAQKEESFTDTVKEEWEKMGDEIEEERDFKDAGTFMAASYSEFGYNNAKIEEILNMPLAKITNFAVAWSMVKAYKE